VHPRTLATLEQLRPILWFSNVGNRNSKAVVILSSWEEAIEFCTGEKWRHFTNEASNQLSLALFKSDKAMFNRWNEVAEELKRATIPLVREKIGSVVVSNSLPIEFEDCVQWDILGLCMESEYADIVKPGFFAALGYWYMVGHFPCGWEGEEGTGKLIVY